METVACLNCGKKETDVPLVTLRYKGRSAWICPQCLPNLIHKPETVEEKLKLVEHQK